ncbi:GlsB/YeaQ/YmgE family stress response membrane protein [Sphingosinicella sp. YJ22]|uniref:GlsB/YeaQ/YmgE family stress response membrane protein n=1 Tax=Sphingosinicella sp. YJ22 TaxID=1104780 RepID=UPI001407C8AD|nr:GlsB/YeaQ/YmgE family stress response membrane protein [Sphingosinicella sp. YJ22]
MEQLMADYGIVGWIIIGGLAGAIAKLIMPGKDPGGCVVTILLGVAGALLAGFLGRQLGWYDADDAGAGFIAAIVGALIILVVYRMIMGVRRPRL